MTTQPRIKLFAYNNAKMKDTGRRLGLKIAAFDLPAGHTCPAASLCHSRVEQDDTGRWVTKDFGQFRCYATKAEQAYTTVRDFRWRALDATKGADFVERIVAEIKASKLTSVRIHSSGDFYNFGYFQAWVNIAKRCPDVTFWGYSKMATFLVWLQNNPVANMHFVYSHGGKLDTYATQHNLPQCYVVTSYDNLPAPLACENDPTTGRHGTDDYEFIMTGKSFSLMVH